MSFKVLVIPEDPTQNGYLLKPLAEAILADAGKPNAKVVVLTNPRLQGYDQVVHAMREELPGRYGFWDLWIFVPDADRATRETALALEQEMAAKGIALVCCPAQPEVEIYACVAYRQEIEGGWQQARRNPRLKEEIFDALLKKHGDPRRAGGGRDIMVGEALASLQALYHFCPELKQLRDRIAEVATRQ